MGGLSRDEEDAHLKCYERLRDKVMKGKEIGTDAPLFHIVQEKGLMGLRGIKDISFWDIEWRIGPAGSTNIFDRINVIIFRF
jgi:hypothetical protein